MKIFNTECLVLAQIKQNKKGSYTYFLSAQGLSFSLITKNFIPLIEKTTKTGKKINVVFLNEVNINTLKSEYNDKVTYSNKAFLGFEKPKSEIKENPEVQ